MSIQITKRCSCCGEVKPISEFHKHKDGKFGVGGYCKVCKRLKQKEYQERRKRTRLVDDREVFSKEERNEWKELVAERPVRKPRAHCKTCPMREVCAERVRNGVWVMCEIPDRWDLERVGWGSRI